MPTSVEDEIRAKIQAFAQSLADLVRRTALEAATAALSGGAPAAAPAVPVLAAAARRGRGRPRRPAAPPPAAKPAQSRAAAKRTKAVPASRAQASRKPAAAKRAFGAKRPAAELAHLIEKLGEYIAAHPGVRMEAISKALATPAKDLRFPVVKLVRAKRVRTQGQKQNTAYFPV